MHDRKHQSSGTEGLPAHVGKDGNAEAAQDETGIQHAAQRLGCAGGGSHHFERVTSSCPLALELDSGPAPASSYLSTTLGPPPQAPPSPLPEMPPQPPRVHPSAPSSDLGKVLGHIIPPDAGCPAAAMGIICFVLFPARWGTGPLSEAPSVAQAWEDYLGR